MRVVLPCESTPGLEIYGHAPQINAKNFSHIFMHDSTYDVPSKTISPPISVL